MFRDGRPVRENLDWLFWFGSELKLFCPCWIIHLLHMQRALLFCPVEEIKGHQGWGIVPDVRATFKCHNPHTINASTMFA